MNIDRVTPSTPLHGLDCTDIQHITFSSKIPSTMQHFPDLSRRHEHRWMYQPRSISGINWSPPGDYICDLHDCFNCHQFQFQHRPSARLVKLLEHRPFKHHLPNCNKRLFPLYLSNKKDPESTVSVVEEYRSLLKQRQYLYTPRTKILIHDRPKQPEQMFYLKCVVSDPHLEIHIQGPKPQGDNPNNLVIYHS